jgi:hypothetical protein
MTLSRPNQHTYDATLIVILVIILIFVNYKNDKENVIITFFNKINKLKFEYVHYNLL